MVIHIEIDDNGFLTGFGSAKTETSIEISEEVFDKEKQNLFSLYKLVDGELLYDESNALLEVKNNKILELQNESQKRNSDGFDILLDGEKYIFRNTNSNKSFLQKVYEMCNSNLIKESSIKLVNDKGNEIVKNVNIANINELWLLSYLHEEDLNKHFREVLMPLIENANTIKEVLDITWDSQV